MYKRPAIINNYKTSLFEEPILGLRNLIAWPDNTGNILFLNAIEKQIQNCTPINIYTDFIERPEEFMEKYDALVLPMANMVSSEWSYSDVLDCLEKYPIPIVLVSVGIQIDFKEQLSGFTLSTDAKRLLDLAKERSSSIGARGFITAEILSDLGYPVDVIGCPSVFEKPLDTTPCTCNDNLQRIVTHCTLHGGWREGVTSLLEFSYKYAQGYVAQSEVRLLADCYNVEDADLDLWVDDVERRNTIKNRFFEYQYYSRTESDASKLRDWMKKSLHYFTNIQTWMKYLSQFDMVVGTRFHGTVLGILAGIPSLLLTTDLRTQELADYHLLPQAPLSVITKDTTPQDLLPYINFEPYWQFKNTVHMRYLDFLHKNKLEPR